MIDQLKNIRLSTFNKRSFWISLVGGFLMAFMQHLGVPQIPWFPHMNFQIQSASTVFESKVAPQLEKIPNTFHLKDDSSVAPQAFASGDFDNATAYAVVDLDNGDVLAQKQGNQKVSIASLTKIMTAVVALDLAKPSDTFTVTQDAAQEIPTKIGVVPGQKMRLDELLDAALMTSANDAVEAIKDGVDEKYGGDIFVDAMNRKAQDIGLTNTHFTNPQGFDNANHYSTARDLAVLTGYALKNYPLIASIAKKDYMFLPANSEHKQFDLYNWNGLLDVYPNTIGLKIGNTSKAGYTMVAVSSRGGKRIAVVLLGAPGIVERDMWTSELLDDAYQKTLGLQPVNITRDQLQAKYNTWQYWN